MKKMCFIICSSVFLLCAVFSTSSQSQASSQEETIEESTAEEPVAPLSDLRNPTGH